MIQATPLQKIGFKNLIDDYEISPTILLEIIADSCLLDKEELIGYYYTNSQVLPSEQLDLVVEYLNRVLN